MRIARVTVAIVLGATLFTVGRHAPAAADNGATVSGGGSETPTVEVGTDVSSGGSGAGGGDAVDCQYYEADASVGSPEAGLEPGREYQLVCWNEAGEVVYSGFVVYDPAVPAVAPAMLARRAWQALPLVFPEVRTSPPLRLRPQVVGLPTWLWVEPGSWVERQATAEVPGVSATVTATPLRVEWKMGDGTSVTCQSGGVPYDVSRDPGAQSTDCSHTYRDASTSRAGGVFDVEATMWWSVTWSASNGDSGTLPDAFRSTRFGLEVAELQAVRQ